MMYSVCHNKNYTQVPSDHHPKIFSMKLTHFQSAIYVGGKYSSLLFRPKKAVSSMMTMKIKSQSNPFEFGEYRATKVKRVNKALDEAIPLMQEPTILHEAMRYTLLAGGKRSFPTLCIASCELVGGDECSAMPMACALEMLNTAGVIQDDLPCMDNDDLRRGKPSNHKVFGEATSILASHALLSLAIEYIATETKNAPLDRLVRAIAEFCSSAGSKGYAGGQVMDMCSEGKEISLSELEFIQRLKTGMFVETAVVGGVLLGGGSEVEIERIRNYGRFLGLAYQVQNDLLDVTGSVDKLGKEVGTDSQLDKATIIKLVGIDKSKDIARDLVAQAHQQLAYFDPAKAAPLYHMANFVITRQI
ncbi:hypothetical protein ACOSP7_026338 [Xanthoceras sorbifolium]